MAQGGRGGGRGGGGGGPAALDDPDERALLYVQQYLREAGFTQALAALEKECGLLYDEDKCVRGGELLQLIYGQMEREAEEAAPSDAASRARAEEEAALLRAGHGDLPLDLAARVAGVHASNVLAVRLWPGRDLLATGSADGNVHLLRFDGRVEWATPVASGGALSLEWLPAIQAPGQQPEADQQQQEQQQQSQGPQRQLLVVGSMDGSVTLLDASSGAVVASGRPHSKYVVRAAPDPEGGRYVATASFDQTCCVLRLVEGGGGGAEGGSVGGAGGGSGNGGGGVRLEVVRQVHHTAAVQDVAWVPRPAGGAPRVAVAMRGCSSLWLMDGATGEDVGRVPLQGDGAADGGHSPLASPMRLAFSPCARYLLVALDGPRMLVLRASDWCRARALHGLHVGRFHNHSIAWHGDSAYVYAAADGAAVHVYHVGTGKVAARIEGRHRVNVRDLDVDWGRRLLATTSFDKSVCVMEHGAAQA